MFFKQFLTVLTILLLCPYTVNTNVLKRLCYKEKVTALRYLDVINQIVDSRTSVHFETVARYPVCLYTPFDKEIQMANTLKKSVENTIKYYEKLNQSSCHPHVQNMSSRQFALKDGAALRIAKVTKLFKTYDVNVKITEESCVQRNSLRQNTFNMCDECFYLVEFSDRYWPKYHYHRSCYALDGVEDNFSCLLTQGTCVEKILHKTIKFDHKFLGMSNLQDWRDISVKFVYGCACQVRKGSVLEKYVI